MFIPLWLLITVYVIIAMYIYDIHRYAMDYDGPVFVSLANAVFWPVVVVISLIVSTVIKLTMPGRS